MRLSRYRYSNVRGVSGDQKIVQFLLVKMSIMDDLVLQSSLSDEQIKENFKDIDFFSALMKSLEEAAAYEKGTPVADTTVHYRAVPDSEAS
jgi:hypothetical protein